MPHYETTQDYADAVPYISASKARKILNIHGQRLEEFMNDEEFKAERKKADPKTCRSTYNAINTKDLISWLGY